MNSGLFNVLPGAHVPGKICKNCTCGRRAAIKPNGYVLQETNKYVVIATGFNSKSTNTKTGAMIQIYILVRQEHPVDAVKSGADAAACFDCPLRPALFVKSAPEDRPCYVRKFRGPASVWRAYQKGRYPYLTDYSVFNGRAVRFGAYGEPVLIPYRIVEEIARRASLWTGYTHQWRKDYFASYRRYFMASVTEEEREQARALGWRCFVTTRGAKRLLDSAPCPASAESGHRVKCEDCGACSGAGGRGHKDINIAIHK